MSPSDSILIWALIILAVLLAGAVILGVWLIIRYRSRIQNLTGELLYQRKQHDALSQELLNTIPAIIYEHDLQGTFKHISSRLADELGFKHKNLVNTSIKALISEQYPREWDLYIQGVFEQKENYGRLHFTDQKGDERVYEYNNRIIEDDDIAVAVRGIAREITGMVHLKQKSGEMVHQFQALLNLIPYGGVVINHEGIVEECSNTMEQYWAISPKNITGKHYSEFIDQQLSLGTDQWDGSNRRDRILTICKPDNQREDVVVSGVYVERCNKTIIIFGRKIALNGRAADTSDPAETQAGLNGRTLFFLLEQTFVINRELQKQAFSTLSEQKSGMAYTNSLMAAAEKTGSFLGKWFNVKHPYQVQIYDIGLKRLKAELSQLFELFAEFEVIHLQHYSDDNITVQTDQLILNQIMLQLALFFNPILISAGIKLHVHWKLLNRSDQNYTSKSGLIITFRGLDDPASKHNNINEFCREETLTRWTGYPMLKDCLDNAKAELRGWTAQQPQDLMSLFIPFLNQDEKGNTVREAELKYGKGQILFVDDEQPLVKMHSKFIERLGYEVKGFTEAKEALDYLRDHQQNVDVVITDLLMPDISGIELAEKVKEQNPHIPVIVLTGNIELQEEELNRNPQVFNYLVKPVDPAQLSQVLQWAMRQSSNSGT